MLAAPLVVLARLDGFPGTWPAGHHYDVEVTAAKRIIREQDEAVRALLGPLRADIGHQALAIADTTLSPRRWWRSPRNVLREAWHQISELDERWSELTEGLHIPDSRLYQLTAIETDFRHADGTLMSDRQRVHEFRKTLIWRAANLVEGHGLPDGLITAPSDFYPPRHGHLKDGMLARLVAEDLAARIGAGRALEASLTRREQIWPAAPHWVDDVNEVLAGLEPEVRISYDVIFGLGACKSPLIPAAGAVTLCRAYLALALAYLEEVQERMPDYAEASGQAVPEPAVSLTVSGGTFYGGQFAARITNTDSVIAGALRDGGTDIADALTAVKQAILSQRGLDDEQRGDLLDGVGSLAQATQIPPEKRDRAAIRSVLAALKVAALVGGELSQAMDSWGSVLHRLLS